MHLRCEPLLLARLEILNCDSEILTWIETKLVDEKEAHVIVVRHCKLEFVCKPVLCITVNGQMVGCISCYDEMDLDQERGCVSGW